MNGSSSIARYLARTEVPFCVLLAPDAGRRVDPGQIPEPAQLRRVDPEVGAGADPGPCDGPSIMLVSPRDLTAPYRNWLLELCRRGRPGRPILIGGCEDKDVLLEAINQWRVFRAVPEPVDPRIVSDAVRKAHEALRTELGFTRASGVLQEETRRLEQAVTELSNTQERLLHAERLATIGRITRGLIVMIREHQRPLDELEAVVRPLTGDPAYARLIKIAFEGTRTIASLLDEICAYAEDRELAYQYVEEEADDLVRQAVNLVLFDPLAYERVLTTDLGSGARIRIDRYRFYQVVINLLRNALQATRAGAQINIRTYREDASVVVQIQDTGCGMTPEVQERLFEPFFTTKGDQGTGLGLRISRFVVERHGGTIECESEPGRGTVFRVRLPVHD